MERLSNEALPVQAMVLLHPKEVPLCLSGTVSKICWRFYTGTLRRRLTRSHSILGALSMAICAVAGLVGIEDGVVSGVINLESSGVEAPDWRPRHDGHYHEA
jgi:hypothetical protein